MLNLLTPSHWHTARKDYLTAARACRATLTNPEGYWRYAPDDKRVKAAVGTWVEKARNAHAIAMGRRPVIEKMVVINHGQAVSGSVYAGEIAA